MPNIKSAIKRARQAQKRRIRNRALKTYIKNLRKKTIELITAEGTEIERAVQALNLYKSKVDKAWAKGLFKRNKSSRLKSKMDVLFNKVFRSSDNKQEV